MSRPESGTWFLLTDARAWLTLVGMASTGEARLGQRRPELDGLRGVAILLVLVGHSGPVALYPVAWLGVVVFFALSGFLITSLLLRERAATGQIALGAFWLRRARRLLPALSVVLVAGTLFLDTFGPLLPVIGYYGNWVSAGGDSLGYWAHTWSLAIEEQFYIAWPLLLLALPTRRAVATACVVGIVWSVTAMVLYWSDFNRVYHGTDTRMWALLLGALVAAASFNTSRWPAFLSFAALRWFGLRSYAIYLWHYPLALVFVREEIPGGRVSGILAALVVAEASWWLVERPFQCRASGRAQHPNLIKGHIPAAR